MTGKESYLFSKFLQTEMKKIDEDKYLEGLRSHNNPGIDFILDWIDCNAENWRIEWESSDCQHCLHWRVCGHKAIKECKDFIIDDKEIEDD